MRTDKNRSSRPIVRPLTSMKRTALVAVAGIALAGCGGDGGGVTPPPATTIAKTATNSGDVQNGSAGQPLGSPLQVLVTSDGTPSAGVTVSWSTAVASGSLLPVSDVTDANGMANSVWTLGSVVGTQAAQAAVSGASGSPVSFAATAGPGPAAALTIAGGDQQNGNVNEQLAAPVQAKVQDQFGNGVPDVGVSWAATGGTVSSASVPTDPGGISQVQVTLGPTAGPVSISAIAAGLDPLTYTAIAQIPVPSEATVRVMDFVFVSDHNSTENPAVDTVAVGGSVTWNWIFGEHGVRSQGTPSFTSSAIMLGNGETYSFTFTAAGTYNYDCAVHGSQMTGRVVVR